MNNLCIQGNSKGLNQFLAVLSCTIVIIGLARIRGQYAWPTITYNGLKNQERNDSYFNKDQLAPAKIFSLVSIDQANLSHSYQQLAPPPIAYSPPQQPRRLPPPLQRLIPSTQPPPPPPPPRPFRTFRELGVIRDANERPLVVTTESPNINILDQPHPPRLHQQYDYQIEKFRQQQQQQQQQQQSKPFHPHQSIGLVTPIVDTSRVPSAVVTTTRVPNLGPTRTNYNARNELFFKSLLSLQNPHLFGGDILIKTEGRQDGRLYKFERSALVSTVSLWPNGVIYYEFDPSVAHLNRLIWKVMEQFHNETCIRFIPRQNNEPDFLMFEARRGCFSYIGRIGGEQTLSLGDGCEYTGTIAHEILHAVGFYHHQNRSDRDDFLDILWENIAKDKKGQFTKMADHENLLLNKFDYNSIMLYGPHTFGKTFDKITMKPKTEGVTLLEVIEKQGLSALDIDSVKKLYKCDPYSYQIDME